MKPFVSVAVTTYNHALFIRQCLDSILSQTCSFEIEIVLYDDASTDGTADILRSYQQKHPDRIFPYFQTENQYSKGIRGLMARFNFDRCRGKYIALCEGDDYWSDPKKLQLQVDFLETHPEYNFSMGLTYFLYQNNNVLVPKKELIDVEARSYFTVRDYLKQPFGHTSTFLFLNRNIAMPDWTSKATAGDQSLVLILCGAHGKIKVHNTYLSVYRVHDNSTSQRYTLAMLKNNFETFKNWDQYFNGAYHKVIKHRIRQNYFLYYLFKPRFVQKLYKNYYFEQFLQWGYKILFQRK